MSSSNFLLFCINTALTSSAVVSSMRLVVLLLKGFPALVLLAMPKPTDLAVCLCALVLGNSWQMNGQKLVNVWSVESFASHSCIMVSKRPESLTETLNRVRQYFGSLGMLNLLSCCPILLLCLNLVARFLVGFLVASIVLMKFLDVDIIENYTFGVELIRHFFGGLVGESE